MDQHFRKLVAVAALGLALQGPAVAGGAADESLDEGAVMRFHHFHVGVENTLAGLWAERRMESIHNDAGESTQFGDTGQDRRGG